jgi:hypothetical protein
MGRERKMEGEQFLRVYGFWVSPEGSECTGVSRHLPEASVGIIALTNRGIIRVSTLRMAEARDSTLRMAEARL